MASKSHALCGCHERSNLARGASCRPTRAFGSVLRTKPRCLDSKLDVEAYRQKDRTHKQCTERNNTGCKKPV